MSLIYEPSGKAREYAALACNIYSGCDHRCEYCYAPQATHRWRAAFHNPRPRDGFLERLAREARLIKPTEPILLCFTCDPYCQLDVTLKITRQAIEILHAAGHRITVLTKGGSRALRDADLFTARDFFASSLTLLDTAESEKWEPGAALPTNRIATLKEFHDAGIPTWVSLEPVLDPTVTLDIIALTYSFVDLYKVGRWNYDPRAKQIDWKQFRADVTALLDSLGKQYYVKQDLREAR